MLCNIKCYMMLCNIKCEVMLKISRPTVIMNTKLNKFDTCGVCSITYE